MKYTLLLTTDEGTLLNRWRIHTGPDEELMDEQSEYDTIGDMSTRIEQVEVGAGIRREIEVYERAMSHQESAHLNG